MEKVYHYRSPLGGITIATDGEALIGLWFDGQEHFGSTLGEGSGAGREAATAVGGAAIADAAAVDAGPGAADPEAVRSVVIDETVEWLDQYFSGKMPDHTPKIRLIGTDFRKRVWEKLLTVPYGQTTTYGELAAELAEGAAGNAAKGASARAVGGAVARNPISIIVPCHRVLGAGGSLTGYAGGTEKKAALLELEKSRG